MSKPLPLSLVLKLLSEYLAKAAVGNRRVVASILTHLTECPHKHEQVSAAMEIMLRPDSDFQKRPKSAMVYAISSAGKKASNGGEV